MTDGVGLGVTLLVTSLALGFAPAPFSLHGASLGFLSSCLRFLNSPLGFLGYPPFGLALYALLHFIALRPPSLRL